MPLRQTLADNLKRLMERHRFTSLKEVTARGGVSNGALDRMRRGAAGASVDVVERVAETFNVEPWRLLAPDCGDGIQPDYDDDTLAFAARYSRMSPSERHRLRLLEQVARDGVPDAEVEAGFQRATKRRRNPPTGPADRELPIKPGDPIRKTDKGAT